MIGAKDQIAVYDSRLDLVERLAEKLLEKWPNAVMEDADTGFVWHLNTTLVFPREFFIYRSEEDRLLWAAEGSIEPNKHTMVHFIREFNKPEAGKITLTIIGTAASPAPSASSPLPAGASPGSR